MSETMLAVQYVDAGRPNIVETSVPEPGRGEILVRIEAVTTCPQWDLHIMSGEPMFPGARLQYPYMLGQPGHEAVGHVTATGEDTDGYTVGDRVVAWRDPGHRRPGAYAQYAVYSAENLLPVPQELPAQALASLELAMCVHVSVEELVKLNVLPGGRVAVSGLGPAGLVAAQMASAYGAREVIGIDILEERRSFAHSIGVPATLSPDELDRLPPGRFSDTALDCSIDCTGIAKSVEFLMARTRRAVALFGVLRDTVRYGFDHWTGLTLIGYGAHSKEAARAALQLVTEKRIDLSPLVTATLPLARYSEGVRLLQNREALKVCFLPWE